MPAHGTFFKGMLYGFFDDDWARTNKDGNALEWGPNLQGIPLAKTGKMNWKLYPLMSSGNTTSGNNCRHHVGYNALWFSRAEWFLNGWDLDRIEEIAHSNLDPPGSLGDYSIISGISLLKLAGKHPNFRGTPSATEAHSAAFDSVPISKDSCKTFLLMKKEKSLEIWDTQGLEFRKGFGGFKTRTVVKNLETFDSAFTEDFYAFVRKNDYYFVTESGKLYHAPSPKEGDKTRTMKALWTDAKRPIVAVIEDADHDKVWLFAKDKNAGAKRDLYFELKNAIQTESFDPATLRPVDVKGRARTLLEYLPLIRDRK